MSEVEPDFDVTPTPRAPLNVPSSAPQTSGSMDESQFSGLTGTLFKLFDVDTVDVIDRVKLAMNPLNRQEYITSTLEGSAGSVLGTKWPDLYGPVWVFHTTLLALFIATTSGWLFGSTDIGYYLQRPGGLLPGSFAMALFQFGAPALLWTGIQFMNLSPQLTLAQTLSLFGYANAVWVPIVIISSIIPHLSSNQVVNLSIGWSVAIIGTIWSSLFVVRNIKQALQLAVEGTAGGQLKSSFSLGFAILIQFVVGALIQTTVHDTVNT